MRNKNKINKNFSDCQISLGFGAYHQDQSTLIHQFRRENIISDSAVSLNFDYYNRDDNPKNIIRFGGFDADAVYQPQNERVSIPILLNDTYVSGIEVELTQL